MCVKPFVLWGVLGLLFNAFSTNLVSAQDDDPAEALRGKWEMTTMWIGGYEIKRPADDPMTVTFTKTNLIMYPEVQMQVSYGIRLSSLSLLSLRSEAKTTLTFIEQVNEFRFAMDASQSPATIDLTNIDAKKRNDFKGIFRLSGDELELCLGRNERPKSLDDRGSLVLRLKRSAASK